MVCPRGQYFMGGPGVFWREMNPARGEAQSNAHTTASVKSRVAQARWCNKKAQCRFYARANTKSGIISVHSRYLPQGEAELGRVKPAPHAPECIIPRTPALIAIDLCQVTGWNLIYRATKGSDRKCTLFVSLSIFPPKTYNKHNTLGLLLAYFQFIRPYCTFFTESSCPIPWNAQRDSCKQDSQP